MKANRFTFFALVLFAINTAFGKGGWTLLGRISDVKVDADTLSFHLTEGTASLLIDGTESAGGKAQGPEWKVKDVLVKVHRWESESDATTPHGGQFGNLVFNVTKFAEDHSGVLVETSEPTVSFGKGGALQTLESKLIAVQKYKYLPVTSTNAQPIAP